jgi:CheY-like chemotaxis protein
MRVLLVEDHADTRELFATLLASHGHEVQTAVTGL